MTISKKLATAFFMTAALLASQVHAQEALSGAQLTAYQNLQTALNANTTGDETADEAAVQAARDAGLADANIAGALQESGRSAEQQAAALLPARPSQAQVTAATDAIVNATDAQGTNISTTSTTQVQASLQTALTNSDVDPVTANSLITEAVDNVNTNAAAANLAVATPPVGTTNLNTLPATGTGDLALPTNTLTPTTTSSGPSLIEAAVVEETPIIPVTTTDSLDTPTVEVPQTTTLHII